MNTKNNITRPARILATTIAAAGILFPVTGFAAVRTVTSTADSATAGPGTLRYEIANAAAGDIVRIAPGLAGKTITLKAGQITIDKDLVVVGPNESAKCLANQITISAASRSRVFSIGGTIANGVRIVRMNITKGNAGGDTGGAINNFAPLTLDRVVISGSRASEGGGIYNAGNLYLQSCSITQNVAVSDGGGISNRQDMEVRQSAIYDNEAGGNGGGVSETVGTAYYINSTVALNKARLSGGGLNDDTATVNLYNCTFSQNRAATGGGMALNTNGNTVLLRNTIVAGNRASSPSAGPDIRYPGVGGVAAPISLGRNLIGNTAGILDPAVSLLAADKKNVAAGLGSLQVNAGLTPTLALQSGSQAIDAGNNTLAVDPITLAALGTDQTGEFARIVNATGTPVATVDIGAYEFLAAKLLAADALSELEDCLPAAGTCSKKRIDRARAYLARALDPRLWLSNTQLNDCGGLVFDYGAVAAGVLAAEVKAGGPCADAAQCALNELNAALGQLVDSDGNCGDGDDDDRGDRRVKANSYREKGVKALTAGSYRDAYEDWGTSYRYLRRANGRPVSSNEEAQRDSINRAHSNNDGDDDDQDC